MSQLGKGRNIPFRAGRAPHIAHDDPAWQRRRSEESREFGAWLLIDAARAREQVARQVAAVDRGEVGMAALEGPGAPLPAVQYGKYGRCKARHCREPRTELFERCDVHEAEHADAMEAIRARLLSAGRCGP